MAPRIPPVTDYSDDQRERLERVAHLPDGEPINLYKTLAHVPRLLTRVSSLGSYFHQKGVLDARTRELIILRVGGTLGSEYELNHHRPAGAQAGLSEAEIAAATDPGGRHDWSAADAALLSMTDELLARRTLSEPTWSSLDGVLSDDERVEAIVLVGFYATIGGLLNAAQVEVDTGALW